MRVDGDSTTVSSLVEKNIVSNNMMLTTDGGPLKTWGPTSRGIYYKNNFISNYEGNNAGATTNTFHTAAIYYDAYASNGRVENNTIEQSNSTSSITNGVYTNSAKEIIIKNNIIFGGNTEAILLKPQNAKGKLPGILAFHDHGGNKYFGKRKITKTPEQHPMMLDHQRTYYSGLGWANEIAKRGYVVLVPDGFPFESRRVLLSEVPEASRNGN